MQAWWDTHITQGFKWGWGNGGRGAVGTINGHSGIDLAEVNGTPLTAAVAGEIVAAGARDWGGQVSIRFPSPGSPGGYAVLSYLHMSDIAEGIQEGASVTVGQYIGKTGGAIWSSPIPTKCCSSGPHLHFELSAGDEPPYWHTYEPYKPDANHYPINPTGFWQALKDAGGPSNDQSGLGIALDPNAASAGQLGSSSGASAGPASAGGDGPTPGTTAHQWLAEFPGFAGIVYAADAAEQVQPLAPVASLVPPPLAGVPVLGGIAGMVAAPAQAALTAGDIAAWVLHNSMALALRALLVLLGLALVGALLFALARRSAVTLAPDEQQMAAAAQVAAVVAA